MKYLPPGPNLNPSINLKMAFIKEGYGDFPQALYYLNKLLCNAARPENFKKDGRPRRKAKV